MIVGALELSGPGGQASRLCPRASRWELTLVNNLRPLRRREWAARPPQRFARAAAFHARRCSSLMIFHASDSTRISSHARRWAAVGPFLRTAGLCCLPAIPAPPAERVAALHTLRNVVCLHSVLLPQSSTGRTGALATLAPVTRSITLHPSECLIVGLDAATAQFIYPSVQK